MISTHIGVSLDGFVSTPDGLPAWEALPAFGPETHGYSEFMEGCDAVIVGRTSFDQGFDDWMKEWPWPDKLVFVLTSRPLPSNVPEGVVASNGGPAGLVEQVRDAGLTGHVQLLGGPSTVHAFLELGALDRLGIVVLPVVLGSGIPLFPIEPVAFSREAWDEWQASGSEAPRPPLLELEEHRTFPDGSIHLVYKPS